MVTGLLTLSLRFYFSSSVLVWGSSLFVWGPLCLFGFFAFCLGSSLFKTLTDDQIQNQLQKMVSHKITGTHILQNIFEMTKISFFNSGSFHCQIFSESDICLSFSEGET